MPSLSLPEWLCLCSSCQAAVPHLKRKGWTGFGIQTFLDRRTASSMNTFLQHSEEEGPVLSSFAPRGQWPRSRRRWKSMRAEGKMSSHFNPTPARSTAEGRRRRMRSESLRRSKSRPRGTHKPGGYRNGQRKACAKHYLQPERAAEAHMKAH